MQIFKTIILYLTTGVLSVGAGVFLASQWISSSYSQDAPPPPPPPPVEAAPETAGSLPPPSSPLAADESPAPPEKVDKMTQMTKDVEGFLSPYIYDSDGRRDPFKEHKVITGVNELDGIAGPLRPLQRFDLDKIKLVGIMWDIESPRAMFLDPETKIHFLEKDDRIGRRNGYIATIREGEVVIIEAVTVRGQLTYATRVLKLKR